MCCQVTDFVVPVEIHISVCRCFQVTIINMDTMLQLETTKI